MKVLVLTSFKTSEDTIAEIGKILSSTLKGVDEIRTDSRDYDHVNAKHSYFVPWSDYNGGIDGAFSEPSNEAYRIAEKHSPDWKSIKKGRQRILASYVHSLLGKDLNEPVDCVMLSTRDGAFSANKVTEETGILGSLIKMAGDYRIRVFNSKNKETAKFFNEFAKNR